MANTKQKPTKVTGIKGKKEEKTVKKAAGGRGERVPGTGGKKRKGAINRSLRAGIIFPVGRMLRFMKHRRYAERVSIGYVRITIVNVLFLCRSSVYMCAVLEYLCAEVLELSGNAARDNQKKRFVVFCC